MRFISEKLFIIIYFELIVATIDSNDKSIDLTQSTTSDLAAIGRIAKIGDYYNSRTDTFTGSSIFKKAIPQTFIRSTEQTSTDLTYQRSNTAEEKLSTVQLSASLSLRILSGSIELKGSGKFFKGYKKSLKTASASIVEKMTTFYEDIIIKNEDLIPFIDLNYLEKANATHVVRGITWGGNVFLNVEQTAKDEKDSMNLQGKLSATIKGIYGGVGAEAEGKVNQGEFNAADNFHYELFGDITPEEVPQTFIDALKVIKNSPALVKSANGGKGVPVSYTLQPIYSISKDLETNIKINSFVKQINKITVQKSIHFYDKILVQGQKFNDLLNDVNKFEMFISSVKVNQFKELREKFFEYQTEVQSTLRNTLDYVMSSNENATKLDDFLVKADKNPISVKNLNETIITSIKNDISFIKSMEKLNMTLLDKNTDIEQLLLQNSNYYIYILFYKKRSTIRDLILHQFKRMIIESKTENNNNNIFAFIDYEIMNDINKQYLYSNDSSKIILFKDGQQLMDYDNYDKYKTSTSDPNDPDNWSLKYMKQRVSSLLKCPLPIGSSYFQYNNTDAPQYMWYNADWEELGTVNVNISLRKTNIDVTTYYRVWRRYR